MSLYMHALSQFGSAVVRFLVNSRPSLLRFDQSSQQSPSPSPATTVNIKALPEDCLLPIFDRIPLNELLFLDQVCPEWAAILPSACKRRRTLVLMVGGERLRFHIPYNNKFEVSVGSNRRWNFDMPHSERESVLMLPNLVPSSFDDYLLDDRETKGFLDILYSSSLGGDDKQADLTEMARLNRARLSGQLVEYLVELFPFVHTLVVMHPWCYEADLRSVVDLVGSSWSLVTAKLYVCNWDIDKRYEDHPEHHPVGALLDSINQQSSLQQLTLNIMDAYVVHPLNQRISFPVESYSFIGRLKVAQLFISQYDRHNELWDNVNRFASNKLAYLGVGNDADYYEIVPQVLNLQVQYASKVRHLYYYRRLRTVDQLNDLCLRFSSLTMLGLRLSWHISFTELITNLASLQQLTCLMLHLPFHHLLADPFTLAGGAVEGEEPRRISLPQVKILELRVEKRSHRDFESLPSHVFPSVEWINITEFGSTRCTVCQPFDPAGEFVHPEQELYCYRLMKRSIMSKIPSFNRMLHKERLRIVNLVLLYLSFTYCIHKTVY